MRYWLNNQIYLIGRRRSVGGSRLAENAHDLLGIHNDIPADRFENGRLTELDRRCDFQHPVLPRRSHRHAEFCYPHSVLPGRWPKKIDRGYQHCVPPGRPRTELDDSYHRSVLLEQWRIKSNRCYRHCLLPGLTRCELPDCYRNGVPPGRSPRLTWLIATNSRPFRTAP